MLEPGKGLGNVWVIGASSGIGEHFARLIDGEAAHVAILGVLEARLGRFEAVALGGLDEGVWPRAPAADPWFSRAMRRQNRRRRGTPHNAQAPR